MPVTPDEMRDLLSNVIGFSDDATVYIVNEHGIEDEDQLAYLKDDNIDTLCTAPHKPGRMINNPMGPPGTQIPNPGFPVGITQKKDLQLAAYLIRHY